MDSELEKWKKKVELITQVDLEHAEEVDMRLVEELRKLGTPQLEQLTQRFRLAFLIWSHEYIQEYIQSEDEQVGDMGLSPEEEAFANIAGAFSEGFVMGILYGRMSKEKVFNKE